MAAVGRWHVDDGLHELVLGTDFLTVDLHQHGVVGVQVGEGLRVARVEMARIAQLQLADRLLVRHVISPIMAAGGQAMPSGRPSTVFVSVKASSPSLPFSRPMPEALKPPKGRRGSI